MNFEKPLDPGRDGCLSVRQPAGSAAHGLTKRTNKTVKKQGRPGGSTRRSGPNEGYEGEGPEGQVRDIAGTHPLDVLPRKRSSVSAGGFGRIWFVGSARGTRPRWCGVRLRPETTGYASADGDPKTQLPRRFSNRRGSSTVNGDGTAAEIDCGGCSHCSRHPREDAAHASSDRGC